MLVSILGIGCVTSQPRVVLIPPIITNPDTLEPTDIVKVGPNTKGRIYVRTKNGWELSDNAIILPEGWYLVPPPTNK
jgi:hypothetical protein